jgi:hypothetical protein
MLKWVLIIIAAALVAVFVSFQLGYGRSLRTYSVITSQFNLRLAYTNYIATGSIQPNGTARPYVFTNAVTVGGTSYPCVVAIGVNHAFGDGVLAMTTNDVFLWMESGRSPRVLPSSGYRAPYFPPGF